MNNHYYRPSLFPPVVKNLIIINVIVFLAQMTFGDNTGSLESLFALHDIHSVYFRPYQLLTYMFMHGGIDHLFFNMFALWMFGSLLENTLGSKRFLIFYLLSGLGAAILHLGVLYIEMESLIRQIPSLPIEQRYIAYAHINEATLGASGATFGCLAAFGYLFPNMLIYIYFLIPIKAKWFVLIYGALELFLGIRNSAGDNVAHLAHLGGALTGFLIVFIWNKRNRKTFY